MKIFRFGSCRSSIKGISKNHFFYNHDITHTTKEILQYLDFFFNKKNIKDCENPECIMNEHDKFNPGYYSEQLKKCDIVYIEISSLKEIQDSKNFYYQSNRLKQDMKSKTFVANINTILADLYKIKSIVKKPLIVQGHIDLYFENLPSLKEKNYKISNRKVIDDAIIKSGFISIILKDIFRDNDWKKVCKEDTTHLTKHGLKLLASKFDNIVQYQKII